MDLSALVDTFAAQAQEYLDAHPESTLSVGTSLHGDRDVRYLRSAGAEHVQVPDERTLYEIASTSKVFLAAVLAVLELRGALSIEDPISKHLPHLALAPEVGAVTIRQLATHSSGLPNEGRNHLKIQESEFRGTEPPWGYYTQYLRYTKDLLYADLESTGLVYPPEQGNDYSVFAMGVLGHVVELAGGKAYEQLLRELICEPLGLSDIAYELTDEQRARMIYGYTPLGQPCPNWYWDVMLPQGGLRGGIADMLAFSEATVRARRDQQETELARALRRATEVHFTAPDGVCLPGTEIALPWVQGLAWMGFKTPDPARFNWCHTGTTLFYNGLIGTSPESGIAFAALHSSGTGIAEAGEIHAMTMGWYFQAVAAALG